MSDSQYTGDNANFWTGLGHGALSLFGLGDLYDPLGNLKNELSDAKSNMQQIINAGTYGYLQEQNAFNQKMLEYVNSKGAVTDETMTYYNTLASNTTQEQNYFITCTLILVFIVIFFMLIRKN